MPHSSQLPRRRTFLPLHIPNRSSTCCVLVFLCSLYISNASTSTNFNNSTNPYLNRYASRDLLIQGTYRTGEIVSKQLWFQPGQRLRVEWLAAPAIGNCVISLFSIFNADLLFDPSRPEQHRPAWSEIAFETFGGAVGRTDRKQFQTQYISQDDPDAPPTQRGDQHVENHFLSDIPDIFDGNLHLFEVEFLPADVSRGIDAEIVYFLNGQELRRVQGGDANFLEPPLDIYAGVWSTYADNPWACTPDPQQQVSNNNGRVRRRDLLQAVTDFPLRINCGGDAVAGFSADQFSLPGSATFGVGGCHEPGCSERYGNVAYEIPVENGEYTIELNFQEIFYTSSGKRVFDVLVEDDVKFASLDPIGEGNDVTVTVKATITDGAIDIRLRSVIENPKISTIVVYQGFDPLPAIAEPIRINCGGPAIAGFTEDIYAVGGHTYSTGGCDAPFCSERYGPLEYIIPVPVDGDYRITASFTEIFYTTPGSRIFDVWVEGELEIGSLDIIEEGNDFELTVEKTITDGFVNIQLSAVVQNPKISTITVVPTAHVEQPTDVPTQAPTAVPQPTPVPTPAPTQPLTYPARPDEAQVVVQSIKVSEETGPGQWSERKNYVFRHDGDLFGEWNLSNWGFGGFDGAFDQSAVRVQNNQLLLDLLRN